MLDIPKNASISNQIKLKSWTLLNHKEKISEVYFNKDIGSGFAGLPERANLATLQNLKANLCAMILHYYKDYPHLH